MASTKGLARGLDSLDVDEIDDLLPGEVGAGLLEQESTR